MAKDKLKQASKVHTVYKLSDGTRVPGATTITGLINKPFLITWANKLGLEGIDSNKYRDEAADVGTLAHAMIQAHLTNEPLDLDIYSPTQISLAENAVLSYYEWEKVHTIEPIFCEKPLVSERYKFGGTVDCYCKLDGKYTLLDFKTGKSIYDEYFIQTAGYVELLREHGHQVDECAILRVGRDETEGFDFKPSPTISGYFKYFVNLLDQYYIRKELKIK